MNEEAIQRAYELFTKGGYSDSIDEFKILMSENPEALSNSYALFKERGYTDSILKNKFNYKNKRKKQNLKF